MKPFSTRTGLERVGIAGPELELSLGGPLALDVELHFKNKKERGSAGARPLPLQCLSQFFPAGENINCLGNEVLVHKSAYLSPMGWPGIYSICFSQLNGDKDSLLLDGGFSFLIAVKLIRDNWKVVIGNYSTSLICEIWFDLQDKRLLGIILLLLLVRFGLIYRIWALVLDLYLGDVIKGLLLVLSPFLIPFWACVLGLRTYYFKPHQLPPSL